MTRSAGGSVRLRIGTRGSALALAQSGLVARQIEAATGCSVELVVVKTTGDRLASVALSKVGGKGLFIKELEEELAERRIDLAIHSLKDVPAVLPAGFAIVATPPRADPADVIVVGAGARGEPGEHGRSGGLHVRGGQAHPRGAENFERRDGDRGAESGILAGLPGLAELPSGARIGTGSLRRRAQIAHLRPDLTVLPLRGNVDTRLRRREEGAVDAVVLAAAGLARLGHDPGVIGARRLDPQFFLPAPAQGVLALEARVGDATAAELARSVHDGATERAATAERALLRALGASCTVPVAALAVADGATAGVLRLTAMVATLDGERVLSETLENAVPTVAEADLLGSALGRRLLERGAGEILVAAERAAQGLGDPV